MHRRRTRLICRWAGVVILVAFAASYSRALVIEWNIGGKSASPDQIRIEYGRLYLLQNIGGRGRSGVWIAKAAKPAYLDDLILLGRFDTPMSGSPWRVTVPPIVPVTLGAGLIVCSFRMPRYRRLVPKFPADRCQLCGYDLTGIVSKCPECGRTITPVKNA